MGLLERSGHVLVVGAAGVGAPLVEAGWASPRRVVLQLITHRHQTFM